MNPHLKQLWAAMRLPENFKKSYKFFCRGLDIRVLKNGTNLNRMENWAVKRNFYHIYQNSNMHKKVDMLNPVNSDWG